MTDLIDPAEQDVDETTPSTRSEDRARTPSRSAAGRGWWEDGFRPLLMRLHFYVGMFVGPFIFVAAVTGLLYTLTPQLEQVVHARELSVPVGAAQVPLAEQVAAGQAAVPEGTLVEVRPPRTAEGTTRVTFSSPTVDDDHTRTAFVDPYTGEVRGVLTTFGEWLPLRSWFDSLHRTLLLGDVGRVYSELAASWLWVAALSGLAMWVARRRRTRRVRRTLLPQVEGRGRSRLLSWHGSVGLWAVVGLLFLSATGLTWSQFAGANVTAIRAQVDWSTPTPSTDLPAGAASAPVAAADLGTVVQRVLTTGRAQGLGGPVAVTPGEPGTAWTVSQVQRSWPLQQDSLTVDPQTGQALQRVDFADWPVAAQLAEAGIDAHMGLLFGVANQIILAVLALGVACLVVWGYRMWWQRRPTRAGAASRWPTALGSGKAPGRVALLTMIAVAVGVGVLFPVLGASLLLFCALDAVLGVLRAPPTT